jgi:hypothetical protein
MALAMEDASAATRSGVNRGGARGVNVNRSGAVYRQGVNRSGIAYRSGVGYRAGVGYRYGYRPGLGVARAGVAAASVGAARAAYYGDDGYYGLGGVNRIGWNATTDTRYFPTRAMYRAGLGTVPGGYYGPICNPRIDPLCQ